jgi:hypothetical protein
MNDTIIMERFRASMKALNEKDMEIVSNNLHKQNVRIDRDIRFSQLKPKYTKMRLG